MRELDKSLESTLSCLFDLFNAQLSVVLAIYTFLVTNISAKHKEILNDKEYLGCFQGAWITLFCSLAMCTLILAFRSYIPFNDLWFLIGGSLLLAFTVVCFGYCLFLLFVLGQGLLTQDKKQS